MKIKRFMFIIAAFVLILGTVSVNAAAPNASFANEPWVLSHVDWYEDSHVGAFASIAHHPRTGRAFISYYDENNTALKMAREVAAGTGNCGPGSSWECETVQSSNSVGRYSSIDVVYAPRTLPEVSYTLIGISFYDASGQRLRYAECKLTIYQPDCSWEVYNVDDSGDTATSVGKYSSLEFDLYHVPHIAYQYVRDSTIDVSGVKYATFVGSAAGNCIDGGSWDCEFVTEKGYTQEFGAYTSLDFRQFPNWDEPVIAFYDGGDGSLEVAVREDEGNRCSNVDWSCTMVDNSGDMGRFTSVHAQKDMYDRTMIAYYDSTHKEVKLAEDVGSGGNCTNPSFACYAVDQTAKIYPTSIAPISLDVDAQGLPIVAYMNSDTESSPDYLMVARPAMAYGLDEGNCGDVHDGDLFQYWNCRAIDPSDSYSNKGAYVSVSVNKAGLAAIAYSEENVQGNEVYLNVAQQRFGVYLPVVVR